MCHICGVHIQFESREAYQAHVKRELDRLKIPAIKATYDEAGNCLICGEAGRCPGWHIGTGKEKRAKKGVKP